jgi:hypothetical protein
MNKILEGIKRKPQDWNDFGVTMSVSTDVLSKFQSRL